MPHTVQLYYYSLPPQILQLLPHLQRGGVQYLTELAQSSTGNQLLLPNCLNEREREREREKRKRERERKRV